MDTIKSNEEISRIFSKGKRVSGRYVNITYVKRGSCWKSSCEHDLDGRVAFIAGKRYGNSVWRNSAKRRLREIYRAHQKDLADFDLLVVAKPDILKVPYQEVYKSFDRAISKMVNGERRYQK